MHFPRAVGFVLFSFSFGQANGQTPAWPLFGHDAQHTGQSPFSGPQILTPTPVKIPISATQTTISTGSPVIDASGTIYVGAQGSQRSSVGAVNPDGSLRPGWPFYGPDGEWLQGSPAIGPDGTIYAAMGKQVFALNTGGTPRWPKPFLTNDVVLTSPGVAPDGTLYVCALSGIADQPNLFALTPDGTRKWALSDFTCAHQGQTPALGPDGTMYAIRGISFAAVNPDGTLRWTSDYDGTIGQPNRYFSTLVGPDATVYTIRQLYTGGFDLLALDPVTGAILHQRAILGPGADLLGITPDGTVFCSTAVYRNGYYGNPPTHLLGLSPDLGTVRFDIAYPDAGGTSAPAIGADGLIYVVMHYTDGTQGLVAISQDGTPRSEYKTTANIGMSPPAIAADGTLYVGVQVGAGLYAFKAATAPTTGTIFVSTNLVSATFAISGPATYNGSGMNFTQSNAPAGSYTITYGTIAGYQAPSGQTLTLPAGGSVTFSGIYSAVPSGTININSIPAGAGFRLLGPGLSVTTAFTPFTLNNATPGEYAITWSILLGDGYSTPPQQSKQLLSGGVLEFLGSYVPSLTRTAPYEFNQDCNSSAEVGEAFTIAESRPRTGVLDIRVRAAANPLKPKVPGIAYARAGVGFKYVPQKSGQIRVRSTVRIGPPSLDFLNVTALPRLGLAGLTSIASGVIVSVNSDSDVAVMATKRFRASAIGALGPDILDILKAYADGMAKLPVAAPLDLLQSIKFDQHQYRPAEVYTAETTVPVSAGSGLRICGGLHSLAIAVGLPGSLTFGMGLYTAVSMEKIEIFPQ